LVWRFLIREPNFIKISRRIKIFVLSRIDVEDNNPEKRDLKKIK